MGPDFQNRNFTWKTKSCQRFPSRKTCSQTLCTYGHTLIKPKFTITVNLFEVAILLFSVAMSSRHTSICICAHSTGKTFNLI